MSRRPVLWGRGSSSNVQKVLWALHELGIQHERQIVGGAHGGNNTPAFLALNPNGRVPVWQHGDFVLWESHAILRHLARSEGRMYGASAEESAQIDQWLDWTAQVFWPHVRLVFQDVFKPGYKLADVDGAAGAIERIQHNLTIADKAMLSHGGAGDSLTIAHIAFGISVNRLLRMDVGVVLPSRLRDWHER